MTRQFQYTPAVRKAVPLLIGLMGPSGGGKTFSALRLAKGIQRVFPGDIIHIDTESNRALHYADQFSFHHIPFGEPFGSLDYLEVLKFAASKKPSVVIVDSASHEHEGPGGLLDLHEQELDRMAGNDYGKRQRMQMLAWQKPKSDRRKLINGLLQMNANFIFCFRAKESSRPVKKNGKTEIENFGFVPIAGDEFVFEMTINMLLLPHADGRPSWDSENKGEKMMMKLPEQFRHIFENKDVQLSEEVGERLAKWASGDEKPDTKKQAAEKKPTATPPPIHAELKGYLDSGKVADRKVTIRGKEVSLLEKAKGALSHIENNAEGWGESTPGYADIQAVIGFIKEDLEPKAEAPEETGAPELEIF